MTSEFDHHASEYERSLANAVAFSGQTPDFFTRVKTRQIVKAKEKYFAKKTSFRALDVGCGIGLTDELLCPHFPQLHGVDVSERSIEIARKKNPAAKYDIYDGKKLPFEDSSFDLTFTINVMHHVPPAMWPNFLLEMRRVTKPNSLVMVFEHNPLNPLTLKAVRDCPFDENVVLIGRGQMEQMFSACGIEVVDSAYILFFPWDGESFRRIEDKLSSVALGAQYFLTGSKKADCIAAGRECRR